VLDFVPTPTDAPVADELLGEYFTSRELGMPGYRTFRPDPALFVPPAGVFLVAELDGVAIGCGGIRMGATEIVLDTNERLEAAQSLYRSSGYVDVEPYNDNPNATHWFRKDLTQ
jgi:hypothetical protein